MPPYPPLWLTIAHNSICNPTTLSAGRRMDVKAGCLPGDPPTPRESHGLVPWIVGLARRSVRLHGTGPWHLIHQTLA